MRHHVRSSSSRLKSRSAVCAPCGPAARSTRKTSVEPTLPALIGPSTWAARGRSRGLLGRQRQPDALPVLGEAVLDVVPLIDELHRGVQHNGVHDHGRERAAGRHVGSTPGGVLMATEVKLPRLGQGMESGTIVRWLKAEGDSVKKREPLYELDTDKVTQEVESDLDGVLLKIVVQEGEVEVGSTIAMIENGAAAEAAAARARGCGRDGQRAVRAEATESAAADGCASGAAGHGCSAGREDRRWADQGVPARTPDRARAWGRPGGARRHGPGRAHRRRRRRERPGRRSGDGRRSPEQVRRPRPRSRS